MQTRCPMRGQHPSSVHCKHALLRSCPLIAQRRGRGALYDDNMRASPVAQAIPGQKDMTADLLERAFTLALTARLKSYGSIHVDVRSTAWGLMEGRFGGMTVRGHRWRTPLELTAEQLMVDVGEMVLDTQRLMWQQTVALKNVPQGSVSFTLTSQDLANFMVHPIMVAAASRAVKGYAFVFDRSTASVRLDPATGRGIINYQGVWAGNGQRYSVTMSTPPAAPGGGGGGGGGAAAAARSITSTVSTSKSSSATFLAASSNTLEQLTVSARRVRPPGGGAAVRSTTGSYASMGSFDEAQAVQVPAAAAAAVTTAAVAAAANGPSSRLQALAVAPPPPTAAAAGLSVASAGSISLSEDEGEEEGLDAHLVAEGLRSFFSSLTLNLQGIELRQPVLLVQLPGKGVGAAAAVPRGVPPGPRAVGTAATGASAQIGRMTGGAPVPAVSPVASGPLPALLTITMKVAILQLPPLDMKF